MESLLETSAMQLVMFTGPDHEHCEEIADPNIINFTVSILLVIGILGSYLPQHHRIFTKRSSEGISPYFVLLGATSGTCAIANILVLPTSRDDIACCRINSAFSCAAGLLGIAQIGTQWACFFLIALLFLIFDSRRPLSSDASVEDTGVDLDIGWFGAVAVFAFSVIFLLFVLITSVVVLGAYPHRLQLWAEILGTVGGILAGIQYLPQIYMTWCSRHVGSLSIPMMVIQTPGSFVFVASLAFRLGWSGWSTWLVYAITGVLQGVLLVMASHFARLEEYDENAHDRHVPIADGGGDFENDNTLESDPLLALSTTPHTLRSSSGTISKRWYSLIGRIKVPSLPFAQWKMVEMPYGPSFARGRHGRHARAQRPSFGEYTSPEINATFVPSGSRPSAERSSAAPPIVTSSTGTHRKASTSKVDGDDGNYWTTADDSAHSPFTCAVLSQQQFCVLDNEYKRTGNFSSPFHVCCETPFSTDTSRKCDRTDSGSLTLVGEAESAACNALRGNLADRKGKGPVKGNTTL